MYVKILQQEGEFNKTLLEANCLCLKFQGYHLIGKSFMANKIT